MNLLALRNEVLNQGFDPTQFGSARINQYINDGYKLIARRVDWYTDESSYDFSTVAGTTIYPWPTDFAKGRAVRRTDLGRELEEVGLRTIDRSDPTTTGAPTAYAIDGPNLHLYPIPDAIYPLELRYWKMPATLAQDTDVPVLPEDWHHVLTTYAIARAYKAEDDQATAAGWMQDFNQELAMFAADVKFPTTDYPTQCAGMWGGDRVLNTRGWSVFGDW